MPASVPDLQSALTAASRALSTSTVLFHALVAEALGLNASDHKCLDLLMRGGEMTAGELAVRSGFTTGAITGIVNRLEARGFVRRVSDVGDRRRVLLQPVSARVHADMGPLLQPMILRMAALHGGYRVAERQLLLDYLQRCEGILRESAAELAARPGGKASPR